MGNFSVSHYTRFDVRPEGIELTYALDLAEIPTFELLQSWELEGRARNAVIARAVAEAPEWLDGLKLSANRRRLSPVFRHAAAHIEDGAGGLPVLRVTITAAIPATSGAIEYQDSNCEGRAGWKEIVIVPHDGIGLASATHGSEDRSGALAAYPEDATKAPPQDTQASFRVVSQPVAPAAPKAHQPVTVSAPAPLPQPPGTVVRGDYLSRMLGGAEITFGMLLIGICVAFGLGAMHALSPGHGKTIVAAYLVGSRGTLKHALFLGAAVTVTHTSSVFALGFCVLFLEQYVVPEKVIPLLGAVSGLSIVAIAANLLYRRAKALASGGAHHHHHHHGHGHHHGNGHHDHSRPHSHVPEGDITLGSLIALGVSGGLVPCPSALVLLLSSVAVGRVALGLALLTAFSAGLALVLMAVGAAVLYAKHLLPERTRLSAPGLRYLPVLSAAAVLIIGVMMTGISLNAGR
jgi:ABC-type nickel/cobalt efflux system permease component RcnA